MRWLVCICVVLAGCSKPAQGPVWKNDSDPLIATADSMSIVEFGPLDYGLMFKCWKRNDYGLFFFTPEQQTVAQRSAASLTGGKHFQTVKIQIDGAPAIEAPALQQWDDKNYLRFKIEQQEARGIVKSFLTAKSRISVSTDANMPGARTHAVAFGVAGANAAITKTLKGCNLDLETDN